MLTPRLTNCEDCTTISSLLEDIDCKLSQLANSLYNNLVFILNQPVKASVFTDLLHYRRILLYKAVNTDYAVDYTVDQIANKVKLLKFK
jgi:hypothetical protein